MQSETQSRPSKSRIVAALDWLFQGHRLPAFMLVLVLLYKALLVTILLWPPAKTGLGAFAEEFKVWCFGLDPQTGKMQSMYVFVMFAEPVVLGTAVVVLWGRQMMGVARRRPAALVPSVGAAVVTVAIASASFGALRSPQPTVPPAFPADAIRTSFAPPRLELEDQTGAHVSLDALRGKVVVLTGVYGSCSTTCPMIMAQTRRVYYAVPEELRPNVVVVAVTLDPEHDDQARRANMAKGQGLIYPAFRLVGGAPADVNEVLDGLSIARKRDPETGVIEHTNVFAVVDKKGRLAYRFTLGADQERWLNEALVQLARE